MKSQTRKDLHTRDVKELKKMLSDVQTDLLKLRLELEQSRLSNTRQLFTKRKELAAIKTVLRKKEVTNA